MHVKARSAVYPVRGLDQTVNRFHIPDDKVGCFRGFYVGCFSGFFISLFSNRYLILLQLNKSKVMYFYAEAYSGGEEVKRALSPLL